MGPTGKGMTRHASHIVVTYRTVNETLGNHTRC